MDNTCYVFSVPYDERWVEKEEECDKNELVGQDGLNITMNPDSEYISQPDMPRTITVYIISYYDQLLFDLVVEAFTIK